VNSFCGFSHKKFELRVKNTHSVLKIYRWYLSDWQSERKMIETRRIRFARLKGRWEQTRRVAEKERDSRVEPRAVVDMLFTRSFPVTLDRGTWSVRKFFASVPGLARNRWLSILRANCSNRADIGIRYAYQMYRHDVSISALFYAINLQLFSFLVRMFRKLMLFFFYHEKQNSIFKLHPVTWLLVLLVHAKSICLIEC